MGPIRQQIQVDVARELAYDVVADLANRPTFMSPYQSKYRLERIDSDGVGAAARFQCTPGAAWIGTEIETLEPPHRIIERGRTGPFSRVPVTTVWEFSEMPAGLTEITVVYFTEPHKVIDRLREVLRFSTRRHSKGWAESLRRLRDALESGEAAPRITIAGGNRHWTGIA